MKHLIKKINTEFSNHFDNDPIVIQSPGRVNLIGEHTDYNNGFVLPAAVDKSIVLAMAANGSSKVRFYSVDKDESFEADISGNIEKSDKAWPNYLLGVVDQLREHGYKFSGFDCVFGGDVPIGAGMSSSAALEGGVLYGVAELFDLDIPGVEMAKIAQKAENDFVGVQCGIMDQFVSLNGKEGCALKLDCRSLDYDFYPFNRDDIRIVLCDTQVRRELASSEYNVRRSQCEEGVKLLQKHNPEVESLRDVSIDFLTAHKMEFDPVVYQRCKYVIEENNRVLDACADLEKNDLQAFGQRMFASHEGLRDQYEVSCEELDVLVEIANDIQGVLGARMMGGGFGGCTINLVEDEYVDSFVAAIEEEYTAQTGKEIKVYQTQVSQGTHLINGQKVNN